MPGRSQARERDVAADLPGYPRGLGALRDQMIVLAGKGLAEPGPDLARDLADAAWRAARRGAWPAGIGTRRLRGRVDPLVPGSHDGRVEVLLDVAPAGGGIDSAGLLDRGGQVRGPVPDESGDAVGDHLGN